MKKLLLVILLLFNISTYGQLICPHPVPSLAFSFNKPVVNNQTVVFLTGCDEDFYSTLLWNFVGGNSAKLWKIVVDPINSENAYIQVNNAYQINKSKTKTYTLYVVVSDKTNLRSPTCIVRLSPIR